jgi:hypothetical protein
LGLGGGQNGFGIKLTSSTLQNQRENSDFTAQRSGKIGVFPFDAGYSGVQMNEVQLRIQQ